MTFPVSESHYMKPLGRTSSEQVRPGDWLVALGMGGYDYRVVRIDAIYTRLSDHALVFVFDWAHAGGQPSLWPAEIEAGRWCKQVYRRQPRGQS